jgi:hypothetical protein
MNAVRIGSHSLILVLADFAGILGGCLAGKNLNTDEFVIQISVSAVVFLLFFLAGLFLLRSLGGKRLLWLDSVELLLVFLFSSGICLLISMPMYYFTPDYSATMQNVVVLSIYQLPVNLLALCVVWIIRN